MIERRCWRLLAAFSLVFVASAWLCGQDGDANGDVVPHPSPRRYALSVEPGNHPVNSYWLERNNIGHSAIVRFPVPIHPGPPGANLLRQMMRSAGIIFSGRVTSIGHTGSISGPASASITFLVERAMRGTSPGQILTIQEWAGRWSGGERYRVGERVLLFLYAPSRLA